MCKNRAGTRAARRGSAVPDLVPGQEIIATRLHRRIASCPYTQRIHRHICCSLRLAHKEGHLMKTGPCPRCKKSGSVVCIDESSVAYYYCDGCNTGWFVDKRDPVDPFIVRGADSTAAPAAGARRPRPQPGRVSVPA
jgi:hypothetical protein